MEHIVFENKSIDREPIRVRFDDKRYPKRVKDIMGNAAPGHLDMVGNMDLLDMPGLGVSGSRKSSPKGLDVARDCAEQAAQNNVSVISGNAAGIDFEAHFNCLKAGGKTILVLPEGINHFRIRKDLKPVWDWERALVISQFEPGHPWKAYRAIQRNQLIIALSRAMVAIEAGATGGTLDAGEKTLEVGLPLYVAMYRDMPADAQGNKILLRKGGQELAESKSTKTDLTRVFGSIQADKTPEHLTQQGAFLLDTG